MRNTLISRAVGNKMATKKHCARRRLRYVMQSRGEFPRRRSADVRERPITNVAGHGGASPHDRPVSGLTFAGCAAPRTAADWPSAREFLNFRDAVLSANRFRLPLISAERGLSGNGIDISNLEPLGTINGTSSVAIHMSTKFFRRKTLALIFRTIIL